MYLLRSRFEFSLGQFNDFSLSLHIPRVDLMDSWLGVRYVCRCSVVLLSWPTPCN